MPDHLASALQQARRQTDLLFSLIPPPAFYHRPIPERHRLIFYLGHLEAFDWNHIAVWGNNEPRFHPTFDRLFEAGIDPDSSSLPTDMPSDWPRENEVRDYNARLRSRVDQLLSHTPEDVVHMAIEHRLEHAETLAYLLHNMPHECKIKPTLMEHPEPSEDAAHTPIAIPGGLAVLGRERGDGFGWDNEFGQHYVRVPPFCIDRYNVTNRDFLEFHKEGGKAPHFWSRRNGEWFYRGMFEWIPLPLDAPVYVTHEQATEFATWKHKQLPTEAQYDRAAFACRKDTEREYPWGNNEVSGHEGAFDFAYWDPVSVSATPACDSDYGVAQLMGNGWEWTSTPFEPFAEFQPAPNYPGYSANFFDGRHYVLKGASCRTAAKLLRRSFRNWFRPDYPYVYATFRLVES